MVNEKIGFIKKNVAYNCRMTAGSYYAMLSEGEEVRVRE